MLIGDGLFGIKPDPITVPPGCQGVRYRIKVVRCDQEGRRRILFSPKHVWGGVGAPPLPGVRALEVAIMSGGAEYQDQPGEGGRWPPGSGPPALYTNQAAMWIRVGNEARAFPTAPVGMQPTNLCTRRLFPRCNFGVDGIPGLTSIDAISQRAILGVEFRVCVTRVQEITFSAPQGDWGGRWVHEGGVFVQSPVLPAGTYAVWRVSVGRFLKMDVVLPASDAKEINPFEATSFFSEFWNASERIQIEMWEPALLGSDGTWVPATRWLAYIGQPTDRGYGPRVVRPGVVEMSNDGGEYVEPGQSLVL